MHSKIWSIQYARGIAAVMVVIWHTGWSRTVLGQSGVDLFFTISGFIMMLVSSSISSPSQFAVARLARIVPLYWGVTLITATIDHTPIIKILTSLLFWPDGRFPVVIQGWSLNLEMCYYFLFALTLLVPLRWRLVLLTIEMIITFLILPGFVRTSEVITVWSNPLWLEFLAGAVLHFLWQKQYLPFGFAAWIFGAIGAGSLVLTHLHGGAPEGWVRVVFWGAPAFVIVGAGLGIEQAGQLPKIQLLAGLGEASYSIYLTHILFIQLLSKYLISFWAPFAVLIITVVACAFGWVVHLLIERPMHRWTNTVVKQVWLKNQNVPI